MRAPSARSLRLAFASVLFASCASEPGAAAPANLACRSELSSTHPATTGFWATFEARDLEGRAAALDALTAAHEAHPDETEFTLLLALGQLWALAEPLGAPDALAQGALASDVLANLRRARASCPTDARITAWLGPTLVRMGRALSNPRMVASGFDVLDEGVAAYPDFVLFSLAMVLAEEPVDSPEFARAMEVLRENVDVCTREGADADACRNGPRARHNLEGSAVFMGDLFARAGDVATATAIYEGARGTADYERWDFHALLDARIAGVEARAALSHDADPSNDPPIVTSTTDACAVCHAE